MLRCAKCGEVCGKEGFVGQDSGPVHTCGCGVWVSWELWHRIQRQLTGQKADAVSKTEEYVEDTSRYETDLDVMRTRIVDVDENTKSREQRLKAELLEKTRQVVALRREVDEARLVRDRQYREASALAQDLNLQVQGGSKERDDLNVTRMKLQKDVDDFSLKLRLAEHRAQAAEMRANGMETETIHLKERVTGSMLRIEALEKKLKDTETAANDWRVHAEMYKLKLSQHVGPSQELASEAERLRLDSRRLVGLLEATDEFRTMMTKCALTRGTHYVTLSECLVEEGWVSEIYAPELDRPVDVELEEYHWLPKKAIAVTAAFLKEVFPRLPTGPFMHLLMHLSKVWKDHHKEDLAERKKIHDQEVAELRRALDNQKPYYAVYAQDKIKHLKKAVEENKKMTKVEQRRRAKDKDSYAEDSRVMLKWGLSTMENLSKQVAEMMHENHSLRATMLEPAKGASSTPGHRGLYPGASRSPESTITVPSYRALISPRSRARSPGRTAYGSPQLPLRAPQTSLDGFWGSTPVGSTPVTVPEEGLATQPTEPAFPAGISEKTMEVTKAAARRSSLIDAGTNEPKVTKFKRNDV